MSGDDQAAGELDGLRREVVALRARVAELQRAAARHEDTAGISLAEREELLREAERIAHLGTWTWDVGTGRVTWSDELFRIMGIEPGSITPSVDAFFAAVHVEDRARVQSTTQQALRDGVLPLVDCRVVRPDGSIRHTTHSNSMLFDASGIPRRAVGGVLDRTESLAVEATLRSTLALLEEAQRFAQLGSWRLNPQAGELEWSQEFRRIAGLPPEGKPNVEMFLERIVPEDRARFVDSYRGALSHPQGGRIDGRLERAPGDIRHVRLESFPVVNADGQTELRGTMLDVTDQVRMREELAHARKMEAVGRLAGGIAHDFNNLLTVVSANLELLATRIGQARELDDSHRALSSAASLTQRLLAFGRQAQLSLKVVDPNELVHSTMALMHRLVGDEVRLETRLATGLAPVRVDPLEIERALVNLVANARDVMPEGGTVRIGSEAVALHGAPHIALSVTDEGPGIDAADLPHIFEPFYTTRAGTGGTGLGLATVLGTAEQHGGTVRVRAGEERGTVFTILLPAADAPADSHPSTPPAGATRPETRTLQVLVIDDEPMVADVTRRILEARGHRVRVESEPNEVLALWATEGPAIDLVICDVAMAHLRGPELIARMAERGVPPRVLFITGYSEEAVHAELGHPVLAKPFSAAALWHAVDGALDSKR